MSSVGARLPQDLFSAGGDWNLHGTAASWLHTLQLQHLAVLSKPIFVLVIQSVCPCMHAHLRASIYRHFQ